MHWLGILSPLISLTMHLDTLSDGFSECNMHCCCGVFLGLSEMYLPKCWLQAVHCTLYHLYFSMLCPVRWRWLRQLERPGQSSGKCCASSNALQMGGCARALVILLWGSISHLFLPFISAYGMHLQKLTCGKIPEQLHIFTVSSLISLGLSAALW